MFSARVLLKSVNLSGQCLTTFEATYPRFIHSELLTHRMFSRNSASSRAIPVEKMINRIREEPVIPIHWGINQRGMQAKDVLGAEESETCAKVWTESSKTQIEYVEELLGMNLHKQIANRLLEPFMWITVIVSTTSVEHFRKLRVHPAAEPHFQYIAAMIMEAIDDTTPELLREGEWHTPMIDPWEYGTLSLEQRKMISVARCARVSYETHHGVRDHSEDERLYCSLRDNRHWSPFEHVATPRPGRYGNFDGWFQHRLEFEDQFIEEPRYTGPVVDRQAPSGMTYL